MLRTLRLAAIVGLAIALLVPVLLRVTPFALRVVDGASMTPTYAVGDVLVVRALRPGEPRPLDVVTVEHGDVSYTHRVMRIEHGRYVLRGDANGSEDPMTVTREQLLGTVQHHLAGLPADAVRLSTSWPGRLLLAVLLVMLLGWRRPQQAVTRG